MIIVLIGFVLLGIGVNRELNKNRKRIKELEDRLNEYYKEREKRLNKINNR